ncbi:MAG: DnaJ domain-containing protein [Chloroflexota bacterium]
MTQASFYDLLGLPPDATLEEIRRAYHKAARQLHPDVNKETGASEMFMRIQQAYETLADHKKHAAYDQELIAQTQSLLTLEMLYSRSALPIIEENQLLYVLLDFVPVKTQAHSKTPPINLSLIIDRSTSMQGERMDMVKSAAIELIRQLKPNDTLSIIAFSDRADIILPAGHSMDRSSVETQIHMLKSGGGTEIFRGLEAGFSETRRYANKTFINHMILLTDGRTYGDEEACLKLANAAAREGIHIHGLGMGTEWNDAFLDELASRTGGTSNYIYNNKDIRNFLNDKFSQLSRIFAEQVSLNLKVDSSASLQSVFRLQPDAATLPTGHQIHLGSIPKDAKLSILLEFIIEPIPEDTTRVKIAYGELAFQPIATAMLSSKIPFQITRLTGDTQATDLPPQPIFHALSQITLYKMQEKARRDVNAGNVQEASLRLQRLATQLISVGERELAQTALIEAERIQRTHAFSPEGEKRIKYGTRSLLLPESTESENL